MKSRFFHNPLLHVEGHSHEKKASWLELFYDLIFVAAFIQLGNGLAYKISLSSFLAFCGLFLTLWISWSGFSYYSNRYTIDDFLHRVMVFAHMFTVGAMAITATEVMTGNPTRFACFYALSQAIIALLHLRAWLNQKQGRDYAQYWGAIFLSGSFIWVVSIFLPAPLMYVCWAISLSIIFYAPFSDYSRLLMEKYPIDHEHLSERYGLLTIIVLGESFVKVILGISAEAASFTVLSQAAITLLITCCIWWIYFDDVAQSELKKIAMAPTIWLFSHIPLQLGIIAVGVAVKKAIFFDLNHSAPYNAGWLLCVALGLTFLGTAIIDSVSERKNAELSDKLRVYVRFGSGVFLFILAEISQSMTAMWFLSIIGAICISQVAFDIMMAPFEESEEMKKAEYISDRVKLAVTEQGRTKMRVSSGETIRKGVPSSMQKDFYFFLIEGSWPRLFATIFFAFILLNVFFAGLFSLKPGSISASSPNSFLDNFFFSVQTMSTIGYGNLSPVSTYGDIIVTIEAAIALLGVALMTGIMFAKASRPKSNIVFSNPLLLSKRYGKYALMFRTGNARGNDVIDAKISVNILIDEITPEGEHLRRIKPLELERKQSPLFTLSWTVIHTIDENSPLNDYDLDKLSEEDIVLIVTLTGHDGTYGQTIYARHLYSSKDIQKDRKFSDIISLLPDGRFMIDYSRFHDTEALANQEPDTNDSNT
mgnify:CR=1 FL=1